MNFVLGYAEKNTEGMGDAGVDAAVISETGADLVKANG